MSTADRTNTVKVGVNSTRSYDVRAGGSDAGGGPDPIGAATWGCWCEWTREDRQ